jgi:NAD(P)H-hydrate epimerase
VRRGGVRVVTLVPALPIRPRAAHKGTFGTVLVVAGSDGMLGAAILCARGALRGGAGLVRALLPRPLMAPFTVAVPAATTAPRAARPAWQRLGADVQAIVCGPGLGALPATRILVRDLLESATAPVVLDADALNVLAPLRARIPGRLPGNGPKVLTPHPGEAGALLGSSADTVQRDRAAAALALAARSGAVVVLKGAGTIVTDGAQLFVNRTGNPGLATGGTGDVLAGMLGAWLAQLLDAEAACRLAVYVHGAAGELADADEGEVSMTAGDLAEHIGDAILELTARRRVAKSEE